MATVEEDRLAFDVVRNLGGARAHLRRNSKHYRAQLVADQRTPSHIREILIADMGNHQANLLEPIRLLFADSGRKAKATTGLVARGLVVAEVRADYVELKDAVASIKSAMEALPVSPTKQEVIDALDVLRANVAVHDRLIPDTE